MRYSQLRAFDAVAAEGGFSKAAHKLGLTQPSVTMQVRALEEAYGMRLFERHGGKVALTTAGRSLHAITCQMFDAEAQAREFLTAAQELKTGDLKLSADGPHVALDLFAAFRRRYPDIYVSISLGNSQEVWSDLMERRADAAIVTNPRADDRVIAVPVYKQSLRVLVPRAHRLAKQRSIRLSDLQDLPTILREATSRTRRTIEHLLKKANVSLDPVLELSNREAVREAVGLGLGIGFVLERESGNDSRFQALRISDVKHTSVDAVVCLKSQKKRRLVEAFLEVAAEVRIP